MTAGRPKGLARRIADAAGMTPQHVRLVLRGKRAASKRLLVIIERVRKEE